MNRGLGHRQGERGFTLLEVLVALALLGIALVVIFQLFSANLHAVASSEDYVAAVSKAESLMREVLALEEFEEEAWSDRTEDGYQYEVAVEKSAEKRTELLNAELWNVKLKLRWQQGAKNRSITLTTLRVMEKKI